MTVTQLVWTKLPVRLPPRARACLLAFRRKARFRGGGHRIRLRVTARTYAPGPPGVSHWRVEVTCRCGFSTWDAVTPYHKPGLSFRRLLRTVRDELGRTGCEEYRRLRSVAEVLGA